MTTTERIAEIRARLEAATKGPWKAVQGLREQHPESERVVALHGVHRSLEMGAIAIIYPEGADREWAFNDMPFIAHAREDIPFLLSLIEAPPETPTPSLPQEVLAEARRAISAPDAVCNIPYSKIRWDADVRCCRCGNDPNTHVIRDLLDAFQQPPSQDVRPQPETVLAIRPHGVPVPAEIRITRTMQDPGEFTSQDVRQRIEKAMRDGLNSKDAEDAALIYHHALRDLLQSLQPAQEKTKS